jgi:hypothetical protein
VVSSIIVVRKWQ